LSQHENLKQICNPKVAAETDDVSWNRWCKTQLIYWLSIHL